MYRRMTICRLCSATYANGLESILNLGTQSFTGVFPRDRSQPVSSGPLELVKCRCCGLVQLAHSFDLNQLYGHNYGYRSGLNLSMVHHLRGKAEDLVKRYQPQKGDLIIDIGSNDCTMLRSYPEGEFTLLGIDPSGAKFKDYYPPSVQLIPDFFSAFLVKKHVGNKRAKIITSIAMFYDLEDPVGFAQEIADMLADDGVWLFEQSYLPAMLNTVSYDTVCHEHLEYYALKQIKWITDATGLKIVDVTTSGTNGGSFSITAAKSDSPYLECTKIISSMLADEERQGLSTLAPYQAFDQKVREHRDDLIRLVKDLKGQGKKVFGYGASTKGNVLLQYCGFTTEDIPYIAEVNEDKFGSYTPGTNIPIISETEARALKPDYFLVLPWHFRGGIVEREKSFLESGGKILFPLPRIEVVSSEANT